MLALKVLLVLSVLPVQTVWMVLLVLRGLPVPLDRRVQPVPWVHRVLPDRRGPKARRVVRCLRLVTGVRSLFGRAQNGKSGSCTRVQIRGHAIIQATTPTPRFRMQVCACFHYMEDVLLQVVMTEIPSPTTTDTMRTGRIATVPIAMVRVPVCLATMATQRPTRMHGMQMEPCAQDTLAPGMPWTAQEQALVRVYPMCISMPKPMPSSKSAPSAGSRRTLRATPTGMETPFPGICRMSSGRTHR